MSQVRPYLDEDYLEKAIVRALRTNSVNLTIATEASMQNRPDEDHLVWASDSDRTLLSYNVAHYCALHGSWMTGGRGHASIILAAQQRYSAGEEIRRIMRLISRLSAEDMRNRLEFL